MASLFVQHGQFSDGLSSFGFFLGFKVAAVAVAIAKFPELQEIFKDECDDIDSPGHAIDLFCGLVTEECVLV